MALKPAEKAEKKELDRQQRSAERALKYTHGPFEKGKGFGLEGAALSATEAQNLLKKFTPYFELSCLAYGTSQENIVDKSVGKLGYGTADE